ncbi:hypothetical protein SDJN02_21637, partial [Cucurbita argyrosperma subsp. argyrosperma]
ETEPFLIKLSWGKEADFTAEDCLNMFVNFFRSDANVLFVCFRCKNLQEDTN